MFQSDWDKIPPDCPIGFASEFQIRYSIMCAPFFPCQCFVLRRAWMSLILRVRGPTKPQWFFCLYSAFRTAFSDWDEIDFGVPFFFFSCQTQSLSPRFPSGSGEKREQRRFLIALLSSTSARHIHQLVFPSSEKGLESMAAGFYFIILGHRGDSLMGRATSGKGMVMEDKGMRQGDWCLCVHVWSCLCSFVCVCVCVCEREALICVSHGGRTTGEGLKASGESVIGREMGNWDSGSMM